jgi:hypothetical protein
MTKTPDNWTQQFAQMYWQDRWNANTEVAAMSVDITDTRTQPTSEGYHHGLRHYVHFKGRLALFA